MAEEMAEEMAEVNNTRVATIRDLDELYNIIRLNPIVADKLIDTNMYFKWLKTVVTNGQLILSYNDKGVRSWIVFLRLDKFVVVCGQRTNPFNSSKLFNYATNGLKECFDMGIELIKSDKYYTAMNKRIYTQELLSRRKSKPKLFDELYFDEKIEEIIAPLSKSLNPLHNRILANNIYPTESIIRSYTWK
jgi:hypothetical protein